MKRRGAHCQGILVQGHWPFMYTIPHNNILEMCAVCLAFITFSDNQTTQPQFTTSTGREAWVPPVCAETMATWELAISIGSSLKSIHIAGMTNVRADNFSRIFRTNYKWSLQHKYLLRLLDTIVSSTDPFPL